MSERSAEEIKERFGILVPSCPNCGGWLRRPTSYEILIMGDAPNMVTCDICHLTLVPLKESTNVPKS